MDETGYLLDGIEDETGTKSFRRARYLAACLKAEVKADFQLCRYTNEYARRRVGVEAQRLRANGASLGSFRRRTRGGR